MHNHVNITSCIKDFDSIIYLKVKLNVNFKVKYSATI